MDPSDRPSAEQCMDHPVFDTVRHRLFNVKLVSNKRVLGNVQNKKHKAFEHKGTSPTVSTLESQLTTKSQIGGLSLYHDAVKADLIYASSHHKKMVCLVDLMQLHITWCAK